MITENPNAPESNAEVIYTKLMLKIIELGVCPAYEASTLPPMCTGCPIKEKLKSTFCKDNKERVLETAKEIIKDML